MKLTLTKSRYAILTLKLAATLSALEAIAIGPIPVTWLAMVTPIGAAIFIRWRVSAVPISLYLLTLWAIIVQLLSLACLTDGGCSVIRMPSLSTTPYPVFITLRFLPFVMLISVLVLIRSAYEQQKELSDFLVKLGTWIAGIALYVYVAQISGLPDIPRTRLGTDGLEVTTVAFSYSFHRALGTFREPSGLAVWLMLPMFLSLQTISWRTFIMGGAILLSGSMTAFVAVASGALFAVAFLWTKSVRDKSFLLKIPIIVGLAIAVSSVPFIILVQSNGSFTGLSSVIFERLMPVLAGGIGESNRGYVFEFAEQVGIPLFGYGLGNINLLLTNWMGGSAVSGILSLYLNIIMSLGVVGCSFLLIFLARPFWQSISSSTASEAYGSYAAYFGWLTAFLIHSAEFPLMFGLAYGLVRAMPNSTAPVRPKHY